ncbi:hypothetical protein I9W82_002598 [Candida metapsilosis]|uniref:Zn(2)-C6 fungal-type domain-containing protein n=1 Tax=Candida metapsilosis TaxID=273372 RepID=A0A8H7ZEX8_9ASCO|nr:hypothetical protein I9W82_002598 [Candida metapsilosis]
MAVEPNSVGDRENKTGVKHTALLDRNTPRDFGSDSITKSGKNSKSKPKFKSPISNESPQSPASTAAAAAAKAQLDKQKRRKHKNSKLGCPNCKQRRVKCSEDLPSCLNCIKHKVECGYLKYTKEELEELKQAKLDRLQSLNYSDTKSESEETEQRMGLGSRKGSPLSGSSTDPATNKKKKSSTQSKIQKPGSKRSSAKTSSKRISQFQNQKFDHVSATTTAANTSSTDNQEEVREAFGNNTRGNGRVVIQNFDDLLGNDSGSGNSIVYPVYRMHQNDPEPHLNDNQSQDSGKSSGQLSQLPTTPSSLLSANALPGAILRPTSFSVSRFWKHGNYAKEYEQLITR